jgi:hypothetical protein
MSIAHTSFFLYLRPLQSRSRLQIPGMEPGPPPSTSVVAPFRWRRPKNQEFEDRRLRTMRRRRQGPASSVRLYARPLAFLPLLTALSRGGGNRSVACRHQEYKYKSTTGRGHQFRSNHLSYHINMKVKQQQQQQTSVLLVSIFPPLQVCSVQTSAVIS